MNNRIYKFRAWDKIRKKMSMPFTLEDIDDCVISNQMCDGKYYRLFDCEILQYTGLKDKNGKEIYEGDIIRANFADIKYKEIKEFKSEVMFGYGQFYVCDNSIVYPVFDIFAHIEIIGNIYENPELLEC